MGQLRAENNFRNIFVELLESAGMISVSPVL